MNQAQELHEKLLIQNHLSRYGAMHSTPRQCKPSTTPSGSTRAIKFSPHLSFMLNTYGQEIPDDYHPWTGDSNELAWAAGLADGEAYVGAHWQRYRRELHRNPSPILKFVIVQNHLPTLERFQRILQVHGRICAVPLAACHSRQAFSLTYENRHALEVMKRLRHLVFRKQREIDACFELYEKGKLGQKAGPHGHPLEVWEIRTALVAKIAALK